MESEPELIFLRIGGKVFVAQLGESTKRVCLALLAFASPLANQSKVFLCILTTRTSNPFFATAANLRSGVIIIFFLLL